MRPNPRIDAQMAKLGYVSIPKASERTMIPTSTLYDAIRDKKLTVKLVGRRKYVTVAELLDYGGDGARLLWEQTGSDDKPAKSAKSAKSRPARA